MTPQRKSEEGYLLVGLLVVIFIIFLMLAVAAPSVSRSLRRDQEIESVHRAQQYQRAIQVYYRKLGHYPGSIEQLENTNNQRFLRKKYTDPLTGKADWRIIHLGEAKSKLKGFFGQVYAPTGGGLGSAAGMASGIGGPTTVSGAPGGIGTSPTSGGSPTSGVTGAPGATTTGSGTTTNTGSTGTSNPLGSLSGQASTGIGGGGIIVGVGSSKTGSALVAVNGDETNYQDWEFVYDPRIEQMRAQTSMLGGPASSTPASGLGGGLPGSTTTPGGSNTPTSPTTQTPR